MSAWNACRIQNDRETNKQTSQQTLYEYADR